MRAPTADNQTKATTKHGNDADAFLEPNEFESNVDGACFALYFLQLYLLHVAKVTIGLNRSYSSYHVEGQRESLKAPLHSVVAVFRTDGGALAPLLVFTHTYPNIIPLGFQHYHAYFLTPPS